MHLAVVDPGVGAARRAVALQTAEEDRLLVGPDNGLLLPAAERFGGIAAAVEISASPWRLEPVSATFHGRDVFAPVAARLAAGAPLAEAGTPLEPVELVPLDLPLPRREPGALRATVIGIDTFGNVSLLADHRDLEAAGLAIGRAVVVRAGANELTATYARTFADVAPGDALVFEDAARMAAIAVNTGRRGAAAGRPPGRRADPRGAVIGRPRLHLRATPSTNDRARDLALAGAPHGTLVSAGVQTAGRGRQGRAWAAPPGSALLCSLVLREHDDLLPLRAGLAVADLAGADAQVKWPNDVLLGGRKLAGVLVEARPQEGWAVLGIGVNVAVDPADLPPELRDRAATLGRPRGALEPALDELLRALAARLDQPARDCLAALRARDALRDRPVRWAGGAGTGAGIDDGGALLVRRQDGTLAALAAGEVHLEG